MNANEMMEKYLEYALQQTAESGRLNTFGAGLIDVAAQLATIAQAQAAVRQAEAAVRQAEALEKLANCINVAGQVCVQSETVS